MRGRVRRCDADVPAFASLDPAACCATLRRLGPRWGAVYAPPLLVRRHPQRIVVPMRVSRSWPGAGMNIFGAFTFGGLIKTFLPGFVWLAAFVLFEADISQITGSENVLWNYAQHNDQSALVLAIPISILLGLISNIIVFMGVNDCLVRTPIQKSNPGLLSLYDELCKRLRTKCWDSLSDMDQSFKSAFDKNIDGEIVLLNTIGVEALAYVREQYWYYLEFQMNLFLSVVAIAVALIISSIVNARSVPMMAVLIAACVIVSLCVLVFLVSAARKNYARHMAKMASAMAAALCAGQEPGSGAG